MALQQWARPNEIWKHYEQMLDALTVLRNLPLDAPSLAQSTFMAMTRAEFERALGEMRAELDLEVSLALAASFEAALRVDYKERATRKLGPRRLRNLWKRFKEAVRLEDLLDAWRVEQGHPAVFSEFKQVIQYRHWLAHGRHWDQKSGLREPTPEQLYERGIALLEILPDLLSD